MTGQTRAQRNNNPGNLRVGPKWLGLMSRAQMTPAQLEEAQFCVFTSAAWGFRALALTLKNYVALDGVAPTVDALIARFAPSTENDTAAYVKAVSAACDVAPDATLDLGDAATLQDLGRAIAVHESGAWLFSQHDLMSGVDMALSR